MKLFRFDPEVGRTIDQHKSSGFILSKVAHLFDEAVIHCAYLDPNGLIGYDQAAYWDKGEWHESGTETAMILIIGEGVNVDPAKRMPPV